MKYLSEIEAEFDGAVVAAEDVGKDAGISNVRHQAVADDEIVDAPAYVLLTGLEAIGPPGILHLIRIEGAEGVLEAAGQKTAEGVALLVSKAGITAVGLRILEVYFLVGYVKVAAEDDGFLGIKVFQVLAEVGLPGHAVVQPAQSVL